MKPTLVHSADLEYRTLAEARVNVDRAHRLDGLAIVFNSQSVDLGGFVEVIAPEAVDRTLAGGADVRALVDHDAAKILGRTRAGTLTMRKESRGLRVRIETDPEISYVKDLLRSVDRGDVSGMSFGFRVMPNGDDWDFNQSPPLRTIYDMQVREVSVVTFPAYEATNVDIAMRSMLECRSAHGLNGSRLGWLKRWHAIRVAGG